MRRKLRRKRILIPLSMVCGVIFLIVRLAQYWKSRNPSDFDAPIVQATAAQSSAILERVRVSDVIAVNEFISGGSTAPTSATKNLSYAYNRRLSDKIGAYRALPDTRDEACRARNDYLPQQRRHNQRLKVSVIIAFHNEARSTLMRTIMVVYRRTPSQYLHELILLDDGSEDASLLSSLRHLTVPPFARRTFNFGRQVSENGTADPHWRYGRDDFFAVIKMQRNSRRLGLIESRNRGARLATGDYLFFLDSHCEVNVGWLEPLLERAAYAGNAAIAVSPVLDSIDAETLQYRGSSPQLMGGFDWNLHFHWVRRERERQSGGDDAATAAALNLTTSFRSPITAGGIFLISSKQFHKLNGFNTLLEIWGGESIEFSIKLWLCGGEIEIVPCSRVGHIFRKEHPFQFPKGVNGQMTYLRNSKVIAESWLDSYKHFFYALKPAAKNLKLNILSSELEFFKQQRKCKTFDWYLKNVFPQLKLPNDDFIAFGKLSTAERCLHITRPHQWPELAANQQQPHVHLQMANCYQSDVTRWYLHRHNGLLHSSSGACLNVIRTAKPPAMQFSKAMSLSSSQSQSQLPPLPFPASFPYLNQTLYLDAVAGTYFIVVLQYCRQTTTTTTTKRTSMKRSTTPKRSSTAPQRWLRRGAQLIHEQTHLCLDNPLNDVVAVSHCRHEAPSQLFHFTMEMQQLWQL